MSCVSFQPAGDLYTTLRHQPSWGRGLPRHHGDVPRDDVAAVLLSTLDVPNTINQHFEVLAGDTPIAQALVGI